MIVCIRLVGNPAWGEVTYTIVLLSFLTFLVDQGLSGAPLLYRLQDRALDKKLFAFISSYRLGMAVLLIGALHLADKTVHPLGDLTLTYSFVLLGRAFNIDWWFQRREMYQVTMLTQSIRTLVFFSLIPVMIKPGGSAFSIVLLEMLSEAAGILAGILLMRFGVRYAGTEGNPAFHPWELLRFAWPFVVIGLLNNVQASVDILFLKFFCGSELVAQYDMGIKIGFLYFFLGGTIIQIIRPKLTRFHQSGDVARIRQVLRVAGDILLVLGAALLLVSFYFAEEFIALAFKRDPPVTVFVFRWTSVWVCTTFMTMLNTDTLLSLGRKRDYVKAAWICAMVNIAANVVLLQAFSAWGAIFAKMLSEAAFMGFAHRKLPADLRRVLTETVLYQGGLTLGLVGLYFLSEKTGQPPLFLGLSLLLCGAVVYKRKVFTREAFAIIRKN